MNAIYLIREPRTGHPRYVGQSVDPVRRLREHCSSPGPLGEWLRSLDTPATLEVLERTANWKAAERRWIKHFRARGIHLLNRTAGGDHSPMVGRQHAPEFKERQRQRMRGNTHGAGGKGKPKSAEHRARISAGLQGHPVSQRTIDRLRTDPPFAGRTHSEETKAKMRAAWERRRASA